MILLALLLALALSHISWSAKIISTFTDADRQVFFKRLTGPNGYPDGTHTDLRQDGAYDSFQVVSLDPGCAGRRASL